MVEGEFDRKAYIRLVRSRDLDRRRAGEMSITLKCGPSDESLGVHCASPKSIRAAPGGSTCTTTVVLEKITTIYLSASLNTNNSQGIRLLSVDCTEVRSAPPSNLNATYERPPLVLPLNVSVVDLIRPIFKVVNGSEPHVGPKTVIEIITSTSKVVEFKAHPTFTLPVYAVASITAKLVPMFASGNVSMAALAVHNLKVIELKEDTIVLELPRFSVACFNDSTCYYGLQFANAKVMNGGLAVGGAFACPDPNSNMGNPSPSECYDDVLAPQTSEATATYHVVKYVDYCSGFPMPGSSLANAVCYVEESAQQCACGRGDSCRPCGQGGLCPGGHESRTFPGFFTKDSSSCEPPTPCEPPATDRCPGFEGKQTKCGEAYQGRLSHSPCLELPSNPTQHSSPASVQVLASALPKL